jgi:probable rRNA maturation factor
MKKKAVKLKVILQNRGRSHKVPTQKQFQQWAQAAALPQNADEFELTIRIVSKTESARLNQQFRSKTGPTNVLSFSYDAAFVEKISLGDLVLCAALVEEEAEAQGKTASAHWAHLTVHGVLHLQGFDHVKAADAKKMEQLEVRILRELGFPDPYRSLKEKYE